MFATGTHDGGVHTWKQGGDGPENDARDAGSASTTIATSTTAHLDQWFMNPPKVQEGEEKQYFFVM